MVNFILFFIFLAPCCFWQDIWEKMEQLSVFRHFNWDIWLRSSDVPIIMQINPGHRCFWNNDCTFFFFFFLEDLSVEDTLLQLSAELQVASTIAHTPVCISQTTARAIFCFPSSKMHVHCQVHAFVYGEGSVVLECKKITWVLHSSTMTSAWGWCTFCQRFANPFHSSPFPFCMLFPIIQFCSVSLFTCYSSFLKENPQTFSNIFLKKYTF